MMKTKKSFMAAAVGSAFVAPVANAEVTIAGSINMSIEYLNVGKESDSFAAARSANGFGSPQPHDGVGNLGLASNYTNISISSQEDLGGGLKLDFVAEIEWDTTNTSSLNNRNSHIGLVGESWGGVWYGSNENLYERYLYKTDPFDEAAGLAGNLQIMGTPGGAVFSTCSKGDIATQQNEPGSCGYTWYRRDAQAIWYDSPTWGGFSFGAVLQTNFDKQAAPNASINPYMWQLGAKYVGESIPLQAWGAYGRRKDQFGLVGFLDTYSNATAAGTGLTPPALTAGAVDSTDNAWQLGVGYAIKDVYVFAVYEQLKYSLSGVTAGFQEWKRNAYNIGLKWTAPSGYVAASWIQALSASCTFVSPVQVGCDDTGAYNFNLGYYHTMSKSTQIYIVGTWLDNQESANYGTGGITNSASFSNVGATIYSVGVGIKHSF